MKQQATSHIKPHQTSPEKQQQAPKNKKYNDNESKQIWQRILSSMHDGIPDNDISRTCGMALSAE